MGRSRAGSGWIGGVAALVLLTGGCGGEPSGVSPDTGTTLPAGQATKGGSSGNEGPPRMGPIPEEPSGQIGQGADPAREAPQ